MNPSFKVKIPFTCTCSYIFSKNYYTILISNLQCLLWFTTWRIRREIFLLQTMGVCDFSTIHLCHLIIRVIQSFTCFTQRTDFTQRRFLWILGSLGRRFEHSKIFIFRDIWGEIRVFQSCSCTDSLVLVKLQQFLKSKMQLSVHFGTFCWIIF